MKCAMAAAFGVVCVLLAAGPAIGIGISFEITSGGTLEDAILIASAAGEPPRIGVPLGDLDLSSVTGVVVDVPVDAAATHWWLIGHQGGNVVYSSNLNLSGVDMYSVEPYDIAGARTAWNIPANLDGYVNGTPYTVEWWVQTVTNHSSHLAADEAVSNLWRFSSPGHDLGLVMVSLHTNEPPIIPEPATLFLLGVGALAVLRRRR